jgi:hypothetical protein
MLYRLSVALTQFTNLTGLYLYQSHLLPCDIRHTFNVDNYLSLISIHLQSYRSAHPYWGTHYPYTQSWT